jgi:HK97 family phage major capsid protein
MPEENEETTVEVEKEFLQGAIADTITGANAPLLEVLGEMRNEFKHMAEERLKELKEPAEKIAVGGEITPENDALPTPFKSFGEQMQAVALAGSDQGEIHKGLKEINKVASGLNETTPSDGGFLVQTDQVNELLQKIHSDENLMSRARVLPISTNSNKISLPMVDETSRADGSRMGGIRGYWKDEAAALTASAPTVGELNLVLEKLTGLVYVTDELLADSTALASWLSDGFADEMIFKINDAMYNGDGAGKPLGIVGAPGTVSVAKETAQAADTVVSENIFKMYSRLWARSLGNAVWHINQDVNPELFNLKLAVGTGGIPVYLPAGGISASPHATLMGRPIIPIEQAPTLGDVGDISFVDWSQYIMAEKGGLQASSSIHVKFTTDETAYKFTTRVAGQPSWKSVLTPFSGSTNTLSPFVTLAERA